MNYITLNGVKSNTITGLLIQSLPSISKPLVRTEVEEIDGRDGDIITKLGYAAYDKEISVGLYGSYSINRVVAYFDSEGTVIFSNEADKYYKYTIIEQIDFERLLRFRTATVTFHVQPFKYSAVQKPISATAGATSLTIINTGNVYALPHLSLTGSGNIALSVNGSQILSIVLGSNENIVIDAEEMEAYSGGILKNRQVTGNYDNFRLNAGANLIEWAGNVTELEISNYSRWI